MYKISWEEPKSVRTNNLCVANQICDHSVVFLGQYELFSLQANSSRVSRYGQCRARIRFTRVQRLVYSGSVRDTPVQLQAQAYTLVDQFHRIVAAN